MFSCSNQLWFLKQFAIFTLISLAANFNYGFSTTYVNTSVDEFQKFLNQSYTRRNEIMTQKRYDVVWDLFLNCWFVGSFIGVWISPFISDRFGRKASFLTGNLFAFIASILQCLSIFWYCPELLITSRFITSICMAISYQSCVLFLQECSPTHLRGKFSFLSEFSHSAMTMVGSFLGQDYILGSHLFWLCFFIVPFCLFFTVFLFFLPETPKFLLIVKHKEKEAIRAIKFYHGTHADSEEVLGEIQKEEELDTEGQNFSTMNLMKEVFKERHLRLALILSVAALTNTIAIWALLLSSTFFLEDANVESEIAELSSTAMSGAYVIGTVSGGLFIERVGRRKLLLLFTCLNNIALLLYVFFSQVQVFLDPMKYGCLVALIVYGFTYGSGVGPISWFIPSELVPQKQRSIVQSLAYGINSLMVIVSTFTVLPLYSLIGSYSFLILYLFPSFISLIVLFRYLPETKNRETHEIVNDLKL